MPDLGENNILELVISKVILQQIYYNSTHAWV